ncbi:MAG: deoC [Phycisphaerales bacterium]|nr:deoC [Phycisphaerales bacterium]
MGRMTPAELAGMIDHTVLKPEATVADVDKVIAEAVEHRFCSVCIAPAYVAHARQKLAGTGVLVCTVCGFPHGTSKPVLKAIEATGLVKDGADEVDVVAHLPFLAAGNVDAARAELTELVRAVRAARRDVVVKVIVESGYLLSLGADRGEQAIAVACQAVRESGCDFIKTSTGFHPTGGATPEAVKLMKKYGDGLKVKAAGGMRDLPSTLAMIAAGADRLGMSASVAVVNELKGKAPAAGGAAGY